MKKFFSFKKGLAIVLACCAFAIYSPSIPVDAASASLTITDAITNDGTYKDTYSFYLVKNQKLTFTMTSREFRPSLILLNSSNSRIGDSLYNWSSSSSTFSLTYTATSTGVYYVVATSSAIGATGNYTYTYSIN